MKREELLAKAAETISGERHQTYGGAKENFTRIGFLWEQVFGHEVMPEQVALCMALVKVARLVNTISHEDSWLDAAGYIALGAEIATET